MKLYKQETIMENIIFQASGEYGNDQNVVVEDIENGVKYTMPNMLVEWNSGFLKDAISNYKPICVSFIGFSIFNICLSKYESIRKIEFINCHGYIQLELLYRLETVLFDNSGRIDSFSIKDCYNLQSVHFRNGCYAGPSAFSTTNIKTITMENCPYIGVSAFYSMPNLEKVILDKSIIEIQYNAFGNCTQLKSIIGASNGVKLDWCALKNTPHLTYIDFVPAKFDPKHSGVLYNETRKGIVIGVKDKQAIIKSVDAPRFYIADQAASLPSEDSCSGIQCVKQILKIGDIVSFQINDNRVVEVSDNSIVINYKEDDYRATNVILNNGECANNSYYRSIFDKKFNILESSIFSRERYKHSKQILDIIQVVNSLEISKVIESYDVIVEESVRTKIGDDDTFSRHKYSRITYTDSYLQQFLPQIDEEFSEFCYGSPYPYLTTEEKSNIRQKVIEDKKVAEEKYDKSEHISYLIDRYVNEAIASSVIKESETRIFLTILLFDSIKNKDFKDMLYILNHSYVDHY